MYLSENVCAIFVCCKSDRRSETQALQFENFVKQRKYVLFKMSDYYRRCLTPVNSVLQYEIKR